MIKFRAKWAEVILTVGHRWQDSKQAGIKKIYIYRNDQRKNSFNVGLVQTGFSQTILSRIISQIFVVFTTDRLSLWQFCRHYGPASDRPFCPCFGSHSSSHFILTTENVILRISTKFKEWWRCVNSKRSKNRAPLWCETNDFRLIRPMC